MLLINKFNKEYIILKQILNKSKTILKEILLRSCKVKNKVLYRCSKLLMLNDINLIILLIYKTYNLLTCEYLKTSRIIKLLQ